jgi:Tfp pilus assembly protein PilF
MTTKQPLRRVASLLVVTAGLALAGSAYAQVSDREVAAEALFQEGKKLVEAGQVVEAADKFAASFQLDRAWGPLFNLAHCHQQMGKTATAWAEFREAVSIASAATRKDRADAAAERAAALEPSLTRSRYRWMTRARALW